MRGDNRADLIDREAISGKIYTLRGVQVIFDEDLAAFYGVETKVFNQAVKRNNERFPEEFMFQLKAEEYAFLRSRSVTSNEGRGGRRYLPYVFTEQGVAMVSSVLNSKTAIKVSIQIINAFVSMRRFISENAGIFERLSEVEKKQLKQEIETENKFRQVFDAIESKAIETKQGVFFDGQIFEAYVFVTGLIKKAKKTIIVIDNYVDETVLTMLAKRKKGVKVKILTKNISEELMLDVRKHNEQYPGVEIKKFKKGHDRFMILDDDKVFHIGASLKDLGNKWCAFSRMEHGSLSLLSEIRRIG